MSSRQDFSPKLQGKTILLPFEFVSDLAPTETISTQSVTCTVWSGIDANPSAMISGSASASGTVVTQKITAGVVGVVYYLLCTITTSLGQTLQSAGFLAVITNVP